jgi:hypothetical protein
MFWFLPCWLCMVFFGQVKAQTLSHQSQIGILTCGSGKDLYSVFGHSAIRVQDPLSRIDYVFNYGTFDFGAPGFYKNFLLGYLEYYLSVSNFDHFLQSYQLENRSVEEQILNLSLDQKQIIFDFLKNNYRPENRAYRYDFIKDNCATKELELLKSTLGEELQFPVSLFTPTQDTYRDLILQSLHAHPWIKTGINLILGRYMDQKISPEQASFLPEYLAMALDLGMLSKDDLVSPLVLEKIIHFQAQEVPNKSKFWSFMPMAVFFVFSVLLYGFVKSNRSTNLGYTVSYAYFSLMALLGILLFFLGYFTEHYVMSHNVNLLWMNPLYILLPFIKKGKKASYFIVFLGVLQLFLLVLGTRLFQPIDYSFVPFVILNGLLLLEFKNKA